MRIRLPAEIVPDAHQRPWNAVVRSRRLSAQNRHEIAVASASAMPKPPRPRRRWRALTVAVLVPVVTVLCASVSLMYAHTLWEAGNDRCGESMGRYGGWGIGFNGRTDAFVCTARDARGRVVARREVPVEHVMGNSGGWPLAPSLAGLAMEAVDDDAP
jgi:hypothetical protein